MATPAKVTPTSTKKGLPAVLFVVTLGILVAGGYGVYRYTTGTVTLPMNMPGLPSSQPKITEDMFKDVSDPLIRKHLVAQYSQPGFRMRSTSSGMGVSMENVMTYMMSEPLRYQTTTLSKDRVTADQISIGDAVYVYNVKTKTWWKQIVKDSLQADVDEENKIDLPKDAAEIASEVAKVTYKKLGEEACGSMTCYKYQEINTDYPEGTRTFWFDKQKLLLRKEQNGFGEFTSESKYEYDVTVKAPDGAKEVPAGKSVYDYISSETQLPAESQQYMNESTVQSGNSGLQTKEVPPEEAIYGEENY